MKYDKQKLIDVINAALKKHTDKKRAAELTMDAATKIYKRDYLKSLDDGYAKARAEINSFAPNGKSSFHGYINISCPNKPKAFVNFEESSMAIASLKSLLQRITLTPDKTKTVALYEHDRRLINRFCDFEL